MSRQGGMQKKALKKVYSNTKQAGKFFSFFKIMVQKLNIGDYSFMIPDLILT